MTFTVRFTPNATADLEAILSYIEADSPDKAIEFVNWLQERVSNLLATMPYAGAALGSFRYFVIRGYVTVYSVDERAQIVEVLMVSEGHRNWREMVAAWE